MFSLEFRDIPFHYFMHAITYCPHVKTLKLKLRQVDGLSIVMARCRLYFYYLSGLLANPDNNSVSHC
jgi:hypothetical protein